MKSIAAAFVFFTRLPFWRLKAFNVPPDCYRQVINYWPIVGWLTAVVMVLVLWSTSHVLPYPLAVVMAIVSRLLITGALHEDGLADFFDGFGGGSSKERILAIMKDSYIGAYGVISLIFYFLTLFLVLSNMDLKQACFVILAGDPLCKFIASQITIFLPYARTAEASKSKMIYAKMSVKPFIVSLFFGMLPFILFLNLFLYLAVVFPIVVFLLLIFLMRKKIGGYTGDCCGAVFLLCELVFYIGVLACLNYFQFAGQGQSII